MDVNSDPSRVTFLTWLFGHGVMKRTILAPLTALLAVAFGLSWFLSVRESRSAVFLAADALALSAAERAVAELRIRLSVPAAIVETHAAILAASPWPLDTEGADALIGAFGAELEASPAIDLISVGFADGEYVEAQRISDSAIRFGKAGSSTGGDLSLYFSGPGGSQFQDVRRPDYDPRLRPWYAAALGGDGVTWTKPYAYVSSGDYAIAAVKAIRKTDGPIIGVAQASLRLSDFSAFISSMEELAEGFAAILDENEVVLAAGGSVENPAAAAAVLGVLPDDAKTTRSETFFSEKYRVARIPFIVPPSLRWTALVAVPERRFLAPLRNNDSRQAMIFIASFITALCLAYLIAANIAEPLRLLSSAAAELGATPFSSESDGERQRTLHRISLRSDEIGRLAASFERLDASLAEAFSSLRNSLKEKEVLLREVHHRVKNNLQIVSSLLSLRAGDEEDPILSAHLEEIRDRVHAMSLVHETIYSSGEFSAVPMDDYLLRVVRSLSALGRVDASIALQVEAAGVRLPLEKAIPCALVVVELATNAFKHAFSGRASGTVVVSLTAEGTALDLAVVDDGIGMCGDPHGGGMGTTIVEALAAQLGGKLEVKTGNGGTRVTLRFPLHT